MSERTRRLLDVCGDRIRSAAPSGLTGAVVAALLLAHPVPADARQKLRRARPSSARVESTTTSDSAANSAPDDEAWRRALTQPAAAAWDAAGAGRWEAWPAMGRTPTFRLVEPEAVHYSLGIPDGQAAPLLHFAASLLGRRYRFGSEDGEFDCSGFVRHVFGEFGIPLPHSSREQFTLGDVVERYALQPGDLVFFRTPGGRRVNHVGIYVGDDQFMHAARRPGRVMVSSLNETYYDRTFAGGRRLEL